MKRLIGLIGVVWASLGWTASLTVSPSHFELEGKPGQSLAQEVVIFNPTREALHVDFSVGDFWYDKNGSRTFPKAGTTPFSAASWIELGELQLRIPPLGQRKLAFKVKLPQSLPASAYATILAERVGKQALPKKGEDAFSLRVAVPILFRRASNDVGKVKINDFAVSKPTKFKPMVVHFQLNNPDEVYSFPKGSILVVKGETKDLVAKKALPEERLVLPKQSVRYAIPMEMPPQGGQYEGLLTLFHGKESFVQRFKFSLP